MNEMTAVGFSPSAWLGRIPGVAYVLVVLLAIFASLSPGFASAANVNSDGRILREVHRKAALDEQ